MSDLEKRVAAAEERWAKRDEEAAERTRVNAQDALAQGVKTLRERADQIRSQPVGAVASINKARRDKATYLESCADELLLIREMFEKNFSDREDRG